MELENKLKKAALGTAFDYIARDPERNVHKLMGWVDKFAGDDPNELTAQRDAVRKVLSEPDSNMYKFIMSIFRDIDTEVLKKTFENFIVNANLVGFPREQELSAEFGCNVPWAILMDPTTACNLRCVGCWAADYGKSLSMSYEELSDIVRQGKELGIYMYLFSGGEPLTRKKDIIRLCEEHNDCQFLAFTNGTLIDSDFAREMLRVKNFIPAISVEGFEAATDARRGEGTYQAVMAAMSRLKAYKLPFGVSCCYTSQNIDSLSSEEFIDHIIGCGAKFAWFFHYMPVGVDAVPELLPSPEQREHMYTHPARIPQDEGTFPHRLPERRRIRRRLHRRRPQLPAHKRGRRHGALCLHPLLRLQHTREDAARGAAVAALHGLPRQPALQLQPPASLPDAGKP